MYHNYLTLFLFDEFNLELQFSGVFFMAIAVELGPSFLCRSQFYLGA